MSMLSDFTKVCESNKQKLSELLACFELANLGYDLQEERCKEVYNRVFAEHEFLAKMDVPRCGYKKGDRIKDEDGMWLLSDEDFKLFHKIAIPILAEEGITDENGKYLEDWIGQKVSARKDLIDFLIDEIVPDFMRKDFDQCRWNIVMGDKLIDAFRKNVKAA